MDTLVTEPVPFVDVTPGTLQQYSALLLERLAVTHFADMAGMVRLRGRWTDPGRPSGKSYYSAKVVDDGGAQAKVEILVSLVAGRGIQPGQNVIVTGCLATRSSNYGLEVRLVAADIQLGEQEEVVRTDTVSQGRLTLERLRSMPMRRVPFPDREVLAITLIQSTSAVAQVAQDCMAELAQLGDQVLVTPLRINMLDPVAIAAAIREAQGCDILMLIRGGGDASDFEVFDDPRVVAALAEQRTHRVLGLGHSGNATALDLVADFSANTPGQAGMYVRERMQDRQRMAKDAERSLGQARDRVAELEKDRNAAQAQLQAANGLLNQARQQKGVPVWWAIAAFLAGSLLMLIVR